MPPTKPKPVNTAVSSQELGNAKGTEYDLPLAGNSLQVESIHFAKFAPKDATTAGNTGWRGKLIDLETGERYQIVSAVRLVAKPVV